MNVSDRFSALADEWTAHCQKMMNSSNLDDCVRHPSYGHLVALGQPAVPLIMERYAGDEVCPWEFVLEDITGVAFSDRNDIRWGEVTEKRLAWWAGEKKK